VGKRRNGVGMAVVATTKRRASQHKRGNRGHHQRVANRRSGARRFQTRARYRVRRPLSAARLRIATQRRVSALVDIECSSVSLRRQTGSINIAAARAMRTISRHFHLHSPLKASVIICKEHRRRLLMALDGDDDE